MSDSDQTMAELYRDHGYDPSNLANPADVDGDTLCGDSRVVAYTVTDDGYELVEWEIKGVVAADELEDWSDGLYSLPSDTPVTHAVHWADTPHGEPKVISVGFGDAWYGDDSQLDDPHRWGRLAVSVRAQSDDFIRFAP